MPPAWRGVPHYRPPRRPVIQHGAKIMWLRNHEPDVFAQAHSFLQAKDFIVARLTGEFVTDYSDASGTNLYDLQARAWSPIMLEAAGLDANLLPTLHASTDVVGEVSRHVAEQCGLRLGTPVVIGGGDGSCASTGAGVVREGGAYNYLGSSSWIALATKAPVLDPAMRTFTFAHLVPGSSAPAAPCRRPEDPTSGCATRWAYRRRTRRCGARSAPMS